MFLTHLLIPAGFQSTKASYLSMDFTSKVLITHHHFNADSKKERNPRSSSRPFHGSYLTFFKSLYIGYYSTLTIIYTQEMLRETMDKHVHSKKCE